MRPLKLAPTISTPKPSNFSLNFDVSKRIKEREDANIVEGYIITQDVENNAIYKFYAEINIDNDRLWSLIKYIISGFQSDVALIYHHIDEEPSYGNYVDKYELINELGKYEVELAQDGFLKFGAIHHAEGFLEEVFVEKSKYIKYWGMDKETFTMVMEQFGLYPVKGLNFIDEYPMQTEVLSLHCENCLATGELLRIFDNLYKIEK